MSVRPVVITGEHVLHRPAARVEAYDDALGELVQDMFETMDAARGVGLAAPQVGVPLRVFTYEMANEDGVPARGVVVNPILSLGRISQDRPDPDDDSEGCLSVPGESFPLKRADRVTVSAFDPSGEPFTFEATGWFARVMQHEFDHLNGLLYVDRLDARQSKKARKAIRANGWGTPGHTWMPGVDRDPFGHDDPPGESHVDASGHDDRVV